MAKRSFNYVRNVAGYRLKRIVNWCYEQTLPDGKRRWYAHYKAHNSNKDVWKYTAPFTDKPTKESRGYPTLTDAVIAANKK
jgi:hypothetical protein